MSTSRFAPSVAVLLVAVIAAPGCHAAAKPTLSAGENGVPTGGAPVGFPQFPSISPAGDAIVFSWAGDLWSAPTSGPSRGVATRLTAHPALERRSAFSPDGTLLAFESDREGARNIYLTNLGTSPSGQLLAGPIRRLTTSDKPQNLAGFSADGSAVLFFSSQEPSIYRATRMFSVPIAGDAAAATAPVTRIADAFGSAPHPTKDGAGLIFTRGRYDFTRPAYRGSGDMDVYRMTTGADGTPSFQQLTTFDGSDGDGFPLPDGSMAFVSSRDGQNNLYVLAAGKTDADAGALTQVTRFSPGAANAASIGHGVRDLYVSPSGEAVFAVWDTLYRLDLTKPGSAPEAIALAAAADTADLEFDRMNLDKKVTEAALSPDGKTLAVVARGEVYVRSTEEGRPTRRVTETPGRERELAWSPDGRVLYFTSDQSGRNRVYQATVSLSREDLAPKKDEKAEEAKDEAPNGDGQPADADAGQDAKPAEADKAKKAEKKPDHGKRWSESLRFAVEPVRTGVPENVDEHAPLPSPDGKRLLVTRGLGDLVLLELADGSTRTVLHGWNDPETLWVPDSRHLVLCREDLDYNSDIWLMDTVLDEQGAQPEPLNLTKHPDNDVSPRLTADGKVLYFLSERSGENDRFDVWAINLDRKLDGLRQYELDEYVKKAAEAAKKAKPLGAAADEKKDKDADKSDKAKDEKPAKKPEPLKFDTDDAYLRARRVVSMLGSEADLAITPGGDRIIFSADIDGKRTLVSVDHKGEDRKTIDTTNPSNVTVSLTGDKVVYVKAGSAATSSPSGGKVEAIAIDAPVVIEVPLQQRQKFIETARIIGDRFYHPTLKGLDWPALSERYLSLATQTRTSDEFNRVGNMLFGELDGSHLGIMGGPSYSAPAPAIGFLGIDATAVPGGFRVDKVLADGPAARETSTLRVGDVITAIDGVSLGAAGALPTTDLGAALVGRAGKETLLEVVRTEPGMSPYVLITPVSSSANDDLRYDDEVRSRRQTVSRLSDGKLGYLHIRGMSEPSVREFERDLFAAANGKQGLIIDVRDNGGGWTADILLTSLTAPRHAWTMPRGVDAASVPHDSYPRDRRLIYAYSRPISVLCNENSFSNAEIFSHAIKTTGRGKVVGAPTFGGVISTGAATLIDGTLVRTPFRGWYVASTGVDMENNGAQPDIIVLQTPADEAAGLDPQLEAAVAELLERTAGTNNQ
ncbi:MAG: PD40 domain-containing protein [Phycisphaeraceae bacterium]|nr:PD40 domain-containing protein [Phycisphaeraceae bacterium]